MLVMAEKPSADAGGLRTRAIRRRRVATGYPHLYSIAAHAERRGEGFGKPRCLPDISRVGFGVGHLRSWRPGFAVALGGCGNTDSWVEASPAAGLARAIRRRRQQQLHRDPGATKLSLRWTRSVKGSLAAGPALSARGYLALNAQTPGGCSLMEWENDDNGRQRWCVRLFQGGGFAGPLFDGFDNLYVGQPGAFLSFPRDAVDAVAAAGDRNAATPRFLGHGQLLVATHLGQVLVFDAHRGVVVGSPMDLVEGVDPTDATRGLADCAPGPAGLPGRRRAGLLGSQPGWWCWASGSRAPGRRCWSG